VVLDSHFDAFLLPDFQWLVVGVDALLFGQRRNVYWKAAAEMYERMLSCALQISYLKNIARGILASVKTVCG
jgi:hypothetical protein